MILVVMLGEFPDRPPLSSTDLKISENLLSLGTTDLAMESADVASIVPSATLSVSILNASKSFSFENAASLLALFVGLNICSIPLINEPARSTTAA